MGKKKVITASGTTMAQAAGKIALRLLDFLAHRGKLLVAGVNP